MTLNDELTITKVKKEIKYKENSSYYLHKENNIWKMNS